MRLKKVHVKEYKSIWDSTEFEIDDITCLVGKTEAGKTAILEAIHKLNPSDPSEGNFDVTEEYPRREVIDYNLDVERGKREPATVVTATFELEEPEIQLVEEQFGSNCFKSKILVLTKGYENERRFTLKINDAACIAHLADKLKTNTELKKQLQKLSSIKEAYKILSENAQTDEDKELLEEIEPYAKNELNYYIYNTLLKPHIPKFLYFDEYYEMEGRANLNALIERKERNELETSDYPLLGLIHLAQLDPHQLTDPQQTRELINKLEGAGNYLTKRVMKYWTQNRHLKMVCDVRNALPEDPEGMRQGQNIWFKLEDKRHSVTTEFGTRSKGFVWFFSFLSWYSFQELSKEPVILLLDEPGPSLHGSAQHDLLNYFEKELKDDHQVIYTTHSPFLVDPRHFERVRIVEDKSMITMEELPPEEEGTKVLSDVLEASPESLFPLQNALGYEITQTLFIGPYSLLVEGPGDILYIPAISSILEKKGQEPLKPEWVLSPVGGIDKVSTYCALIGPQKDITIATATDCHEKDRQTLENLYKRKLLQKKNVHTFAEYTGKKEADIEDMFEPEFYVELVNLAYKDDLEKPFKLSDLEQRGRILDRIESSIDSGKINFKSSKTKFNHYRPARYLTDNLSKLEKKISDETLDRFEALNKSLNKLVS